MKVLIINNDFRVYWKRRLVYLQQFLSAKSVELSVIELFGKGSSYTFDNYNNQETWWKCLFPANSADELSKQQIACAFSATLDNISPDVIIGPSIVFYAGALGLRWAKKNRRKFIMFEDAKPSQFKRNALVQSIKNSLTKQADALWLPSADYDKEYQNLLGVKMHTFYGYNCVDNQLFTPTKENAFDHHTIVCVARLVPVKNFPNLLKAWQLVEQQNNDYQLNIIGNGNQAVELNRLVIDLGLKRVTFLGAIPNEAIAGYYNHADAFILASISETWGLVVNEAMAAGLPVLLSNKINAAQSLLQEGVTGFAFNPLNIQEIATAVLKYINLTTPLKQSMAAQSLKSVDGMSYEHMGKQLFHALQIVASGKFKSPGLLAALYLKLWYGKHDTSAWDVQ